MSEPNIREIEALRLAHGERHVPILLAPWELDALLQEIRRLTTSRCQCFYGGYQPTPTRCGLTVHTGQHAGIGDNGATVIWPKQSSDISGQLRASEDAREQQCRGIAGLLKALKQIHENAGGCEDLLSKLNPPGLTCAKSDPQHRSEWCAFCIASVALAAVPPEPATHVTCSDCDGAGNLYYSAIWMRTCEACGGAGVSNAGPGKPLYCETCGMTGRVRR